MSACERAQQLLPEWIAGDLDAARAGEVRAHLAACAGCRAEEAETRDLLGLLAADASPDGLGGGVADPGERYWAAFAGRVRLARAAHEAAAPARVPWGERLAARLSLGVATALVALVALRAFAPPGGATAGADPESELFAELFAVSSIEGFAELDGEALALVEERLAAVAPRRGHPAPSATLPAATPKPAPAPKPASGAAGGTDAPPTSRDVFDALDELSPEEVDRLLERLDTMKT